MPKAIDITGQRFGRLVAITDAGYRIRHWRAWICECDCGNEAIIPSAMLINGNTQSCGCLHKETFTNTKHGFAKNGNKTRLYTIWDKMRFRCNNPNDRSFQYYGGKGVRVCERWDDFTEFYKDMYESYLEHIKIHGVKNTTIDRIDSDGMYEPSNCRWATYKVQSNNRSMNVIIEHNGEVHNLTEWSEIVGIRMGTIWNRLYRSNWPIEKALTTPVKRRD